ncbi:MAG TPA: glycosyltransferase, partial [Bryobacteraceae bacterium]|nr:glycosyltransferase [Bryobacteraceae bacterium]
AVYTPHGLAVSDRISPVQGRVFTIAERAAARWCRAIICVSEAERQLALDKGIAAPEKLHVIHNGVKDSPLRAEVERTPVALVSISRFEPPKDFETLFAALSLLGYEDWLKLTVIGGGAVPASLPKRVVSLGYVPDPAPELARAQIFVLSSRSEGFPRSILEAMRSGLPVVASDVGGVREAVRHEGTGLLVPPRDPAALAAALKRLMNSVSERQRMGSEGRRIFGRQFVADAMIFNTLQLYATIVGVHAS